MSYLHPEDPYQVAADIIRNAEFGVCMTGAGISTESGIPDFRSPETGLWEKYEPEIYANLENFLRDPRMFWEMAKKIAPNLFKAKPNKAHKVIADLENMGLLRAVITQNVDGLHQAAGSHMVYELHGNVFEFQCVGCHGSYSYKRMLQKIKTEKQFGPMCDVCGMPLKPNVVLFGEDLPRGPWLESVSLAEKCDMFLVCGSSLNVAPACMLPEMALKRNAKVIIINIEPTEIDNQATVVIHEKLASSMEKIHKYILEMEEQHK
ncbi:MAG TPA: Sir2 family NAD-dependent protein deacetylase [Candidatus Lokiarchaeia archaeon]|nr:Sir2 family NAD-dependent protein deacetylase [Candidatus Lokiarchaeia archaeon]